MRSITVFAAGFLLDMAVGDPQHIWHPVQGIGWMIVHMERILRRLLPKSRRGERTGGILLVCSVMLVSVAVPGLLLLLAERIHPHLGMLLEIVMCAQILAMKSLKDESMKVKHAFDRGDTEAARTAVSCIVGRDTKYLSAEGIVKAAVETVAENTSDGVIAPMLYLALGGPLLGFAYKAVNTMDSMVGYKSETYLWFGRAAARLDDLCNYIPARLSAVLMIAASALCGMDQKQAFRIWRRDRRKHASPNAAQTEAVMAGALGLQLAGDTWYRGTLHKKAFIGTERKKTEPDDIRRASILLYGTGILACALMTVIKAVLIWRYGIK